MRTIVITKDEDGFFVAHFVDDPDAREGGFETKAEAIGTLVMNNRTTFGVQIDERLESDGKEVMEGRWGGYKITTTNSKSEAFEIDTEDGVRGMNIPVTVIHENGSWTVTHKGHPVAIKGVKKVERVA